jgi:uncharacterized membrane protein YjjB (DUF3815 family)
MKETFIKVIFIFVFVILVNPKLTHFNIETFLATLNSCIYYFHFVNVHFRGKNVIFERF